MRWTFASPFLLDSDETGTASASADTSENPAEKPEKRRKLRSSADKTCRMCGVDLVGHRRYKDARGYLCKDCNQLDTIRRIPCAECGKPTLPEGLRPWGTASLCARCFAEKEADPTARRLKRVSTRKYEHYEKQGVIVVAAVLGFLAFLILLNKMGCIGA